MPQPDVPALAPAACLEVLLQRWCAGERAALDALVPMLYDDLRRLASAQLSGETVITLPRTELVHEAYVRLVRHQGPLTLHTREQFFGLVATVMRHVLVDRARARAAGKRGGGAVHVALDATGEPTLSMGAADNDFDLLALDQAMQQLQALDARQSRIVELRCFTGLSVAQVAQVLSLSPSTVKREWATARAWLLRAMDQAAATS